LNSASVEYTEAETLAWLVGALEYAHARLPAPIQVLAELEVGRAASDQLRAGAPLLGLQFICVAGRGWVSENDGCIAGWAHRREKSAPGFMVQAYISYVLQQTYDSIAPPKDAKAQWVTVKSLSTALALAAGLDAVVIVVVLAASAVTELFVLARLAVASPWEWQGMGDDAATILTVG
jgi:hypothetical protein